MPIPPTPIPVHDPTASTSPGLATPPFSHPATACYHCQGHCGLATTVVAVPHPSPFPSPFPSLLDLFCLSPP